MAPKWDAAPDDRPVDAFQQPSGSVKRDGKAVSFATSWQPKRTSRSTWSNAPRDSARHSKSPPDRRRTIDGRSNVPRDSAIRPKSPPCRRRTIDGSSDGKDGRSRTCLRHLDLGDIGTSKDMLLCDDRACASEMINSLQKHDFVFVLRSDGSFTYAIIADWQEKNIRFVINTKGGNKIVPRKKWLDSIRFVNNRHNREKIKRFLSPLPEVAPSPPLPEVDLQGNEAQRLSMPEDLRMEEYYVQYTSVGPPFPQNRRESDTLSLFD